MGQLMKAICFKNCEPFAKQTCWLYKYVSVFWFLHSMLYLDENKTYYIILGFCSLQYSSKPKPAVHAAASGRAEKTFWFCCQSNAFPLSHHSTNNVLGRSFFKPFLWRIARLCSWSHYSRRHRDSIARLERRRVERGGDLIGVTGRGEPLQLWMNFWFELTERRSVREYGQEREQNEDSEGLPAVTTGSLVCRLF